LEEVEFVNEILTTGSSAAAESRICGKCDCSPIWMKSNLRKQAP